MTTPLPDLAPRARALAPDFELQREIGRGGMGVVYLAHDVKLDREVAVKILPELLARDPEIRERFIREARTAARLSHPNIVPIYRADESGGVVFFVMGYVAGDSLADRLMRGPLEAAEAIPVLRDVARALDYAHRRGVVHRDVKPGNVLLEDGGARALVTDFGIARLVAASPLTATGQVLGTVHYMSPEQVSGENVDGRSDLYSLGVVAFQALSGRLPFENPNAAAVLVAHVTKPAPRLADVAPDVSPALAAIVDRCLMKSPDDRFQTGAELATALDAAAPVAERMVAERDAQALWARAAALQAETGLRPAARSPVPPPLQGDASATSGYRLVDVRAAGEEAGISPRYLERAAAELGVAGAAPRGASLDASLDASLAPVNVARSSRLADALYGGSPTLVYELTVDGEPDPASFELMVDAISRAVGDAGTAGTIGRSLRWNLSTSKRHVQISVVPRDGRTTIRAEERLGSLAGGLYGGIMGGAGGGSTGATIAIGMNVFHSAAVAGVLWCTTMATTYGIARAIYAHKRRTRAALLSGVVAELARLVHEPAPPRPPSRGAR